MRVMLAFLLLGSVVSLPEQQCAGANRRVCLDAEHCQWCGSNCMDHPGTPCVFERRAAKATYKGVQLALSHECQIVEGAYYFPPDTVRMDLFTLDPEEEYACPWKGLANYFDLELPTGEQNPLCMWSYLDPFYAALPIKGWVGFWNGVVVTPLNNATAPQ
mmetsp:Transcript_14405/g.16104  ORF Transcript_14405/g.16104 Transcript_14405/m.16104 type:complete len:160 (-) Transcript_14405:16-495(-)